MFTNLFDPATNAASVGASVGAQFGSRAGPVGAGVGAGFGAAGGYIAGALVSPCPVRRVVPDGGRDRTADRSTETSVEIPVTEA